MNGVLDGSNITQGGPLNIRTPARLFIGGWYNNYDFVGDLDEVRVSNVVRSAEWVKLQFENQKPNQLLVGPLVQPGSEFSVSPPQIAAGENQSVTIQAKAGGAQKLLWILKCDGRESIAATDRFSYVFHAGRVLGKQSATLNRLREVQRTLPRLFSNLSLMSTLGIRPPGGCHFPAAGYAEFARFLHPMMQYHLYHRHVDSFNPPNLKRAFFTSAQRDELVLEFDYHIRWSDALVSHFHLDGEAKQVVTGSENANRITLRLKGPTKSKTVTYLDSANWNPDNLLYGDNGLAAFTFCDVPIEPSEPAR